MAVLNKVMIYVTQNEQTHELKIVNILPEDGTLTPGIERDIEVFDWAYPDIKIDFVKLHGELGKKRPQTCPVCAQL